MFLDPKGNQTVESHKREHETFPGLKQGWKEPVGLWKRSWRDAQKEE